MIMTPKGSGWSAALVLFLCALSFLAGRYIQQSTDLPAASQPLEGLAGRRHLSLETNAVATEAQLLKEDTAAVGVHEEPVDPLDPVQLEQFAIERSGLLKVRPPLPAAVSGDNFYHAIPFQILSWAPRIVVFPAFVDKARCDYIVKLAASLLYPSGLAYGPGEKGDPEQQTRTSKGTFLSSNMDQNGVLSWVEERIAAATLVPRENGEAFNVLKYTNDQHYDSHMDTFDPKIFGPQPSQRAATVLVYLSDVEAGGETVFKKEGIDGASRVITDWRKCGDESFKYKPRIGDAVLFWSVSLDGEIDERALHGGCPVKNGTKWVMTKWLRTKGGRPEWAT